MTIPSQANLYSLGFGTRSTTPPVFQPFTPGTTNVNYPLGQLWVNTVNGNFYGLASFSASNNAITANWTQLGSEAGALNTLTTQDSTVVSPSAGNINVSGATNQLTTTGSGSTVTIGFASAAIFPGSLEVTGLLTGDAGATLKTAGTAINIATDTDTAAVNIATAGARTTTIGDTTAGSGTILKVGTGNFVLDGSVASTFAVGASTTTGSITIGGTAQQGDLVLGSSSATNAVKIANGAGATTVSIAAVQVAGAVNIGTAMTTGTISIGGTGLQTGTITVGGGTGVQTVNLATGGTGVKTVHIADGAIGNIVTLGSTTAAASTTIQAGTGGLILTPTTGNISAAPVTNSAAAATVVVNGRLFQATFTGQTTASGATAVYTVTNSAITGTTQAIIVSADNLGSNDAQMSITRVLQSTGSLAVSLKNNGAAALNGDVHITGWILN